MYFVDQQKIEELLVYLDNQLELFEKTQVWVTPIEKAGLERIAQMVIESVLDVGNAMIDGFIMRDPGSYEDIVDILMDEKVITNEMGESLKIIISFRKELVQGYTDIQHDKLEKAYREQLGLLKQYSPKVKEYIKNELGPVSAFKN